MAHARIARWTATAALALAGLGLAGGASADGPGAGGAPGVASGVAWVSGVVKDENDAPLAGVEAQVAREGPKPGTWKATSDAKGYYAVKGVPPGPATVWLRAKGRVPHARQVTVPAAGAVSVDATLPLGVRFAGRITDLRAAPVAGAQVVAYQSSSSDGSGWMWAHPGGSGASVADGTFEVDGLEPGETYKLRIVHPRHKIADLPGLSAKAGGGHDALDVTLEDAAWVSGTAVDPSGRPVAGARVEGGTDPFEVVSGGGWLRFSMSLSEDALRSTDARGRFVVGSLDDTSVHLTARAEGWFDGSVDVEDLVAGKEKADVKVLLEPATASIEGTVADSTGKPVAGASIHAIGDVGWAGIAESDAAGKFRLLRVKSHVPVKLEASAAWHIDAALEKVILNSKGVALVLKAAPRLKVKVLGPDGKPLQNVGIRVEAEGEHGEDSWDAPNYGEQPAAGYEIQIPIGSVKVSVYAEGMEPSSLGPWDVVVGQVVDGGTVTLAKKTP